MVLKIIWTRNAIEHLEDILNYWEVRNGTNSYSCLLYTSDAADERSSVDLGGRRIIKKKKQKKKKEYTC